jgi:hypothetical protein
MPSPTTYRVQDSSIHVIYSTVGPHFMFQDASQTVTFNGPQVRVVAHETGTLVTVTVRQTIDAGSTSFTLMIPAVKLAHLSQLGPQDADKQLN